ncbi:hypothetical protein H0H87_010556 [Tephrocybe sp. NHM501043]|nr:hypothetical protein H0H87_010556 [Tephrocybe sp. NHM501043]
MLSLILARFTTMQAIRVHPAPAPAKPYSPSNPAPPSALHLDRIPIPKPSKTGELLIRIHATTIIRDSLTWPETYTAEYAILGNDLAGTVVDVAPAADQNHSADSPFKPGDEVFGMTDPDRATTWAEYTVVRAHEIALKPKTFSWAEAAALPLSALTAYQALFEKAGVPVPDMVKGDKQHAKYNAPRLLITGASGGVGIYLVQLAALAGLRVVAATSSNARNQSFLLELGAKEVVDYAELSNQGDSFDIIIDTVGGQVLVGCWDLVKGDGSLISVDSSSFQFVQDHKDDARRLRKPDVRALFFIVQTSQKALKDLSALADKGVLRPFVAATYPLAEAKAAYERASQTGYGYGKIVLTA